MIFVLRLKCGGIPLFLLTSNAHTAASMRHSCLIPQLYSIIRSLWIVASRAGEIKEVKYNRREDG